MTKRKNDNETEPASNKKLKKDKEKSIKIKGSFEKKTNFSKKLKKPSEITQKPEDWNEFKKKKKELKLKRKQSKSGFAVIAQAKQMGEKLRCRNLKGGEAERNRLINELHGLLKGRGHYPKFVLAHDTSRLVQWLLKYGSDVIKNQISQELIPLTVEMLQSKYGIYCVKRLLKYGDNELRSAVINRTYGHAVKLASHALSAPVFEYAYSSWATALQKQHLVQEFFGDLYKTSKDDEIRHLRDVFEQSPDLKTAALRATKANLARILDKSLLDSGLVQTVLNQFLSECSQEDRADLISQLIPHIVVISNSKDGSRAAMRCIWQGSNKDRKVAMKTIKEHAVELSKHEHGHCTIIALLDATDDTVLLHKIVLSEILKAARDLAVNEWGRKVLLWLVAPADSTCFHPVFIKEIEEGRRNSHSKKEPEIRRKEILNYSIDVLLKLVTEEPQFWLKNSSVAYELLAIVKAGGGKATEEAVESIVKVIIDPEWKTATNGREVPGIEDSGLHMVLKKLARSDRKTDDNETTTFGSRLVEALPDDRLEEWLKLNRGCFLLVAIYENGGTAAREKIQAKLKKHHRLLKTQSSAGSKILVKKLSE